MDAPWTPIYLAVLFLLHPWLGILGIVFSLILASMAWVSHRMSHASIEAAQEAGGQVGGYIHSKLRNAEVIEAMGMLNNLRPAGKHASSTTWSSTGRPATCPSRSRR
jgi:ATP-binding cassette subfamily C exporter for protease/lipase